MKDVSKYFNVASPSISTGPQCDCRHTVTEPCDGGGGDIFLKEDGVYCCLKLSLIFHMVRKKGGGRSALVLGASLT